MFGGKILTGKRETYAIGIGGNHWMSEGGGPDRGDCPLGMQGSRTGLRKRDRTNLGKTKKKGFNSPKTGSLFEDCKMRQD